MVKVIVGTMGRSPFAVTEALSTPAHFKTFLDTCQRYGVRELDTARLYGGGQNEKLLGQVGATHNFQVSTKINNTGDGALKHDTILQSAQESLASLQTDVVDIFYIHMPDRSVPLEESLAAVDAVYRQGKFKRFGICSYSAPEVEEIYSLCKQRGYVLPSVYQGNYNAVARRSQRDLFPTLRKLGIHFYGFGPLAGGLLAKPVDEISTANKASRFGALPLIAGVYLKPDILDQVKELQTRCQGADITPMEATLRWQMHHAGLEADDGVLLGASSTEQIESNLKAIEGGPLPEAIVEAYEELWKRIESSAPAYHR